MEKDGVERVTFFAQHVLCHRDAVFPQDLHALPRNEGVRVRRPHDHAGNAALDDRVGTRRLLTVMAARLERHIERRAAHIQRLDEDILIESEVTRHVHRDR